MARHCVLNMFINTGAAFAELGPHVPGFDTICGGGTNRRGLPAWNLDANIIKDIGVYRERVGMMLFSTFTNVLNHFQPSHPSFSLTSPTTFGRSQANPTRRGTRSWDEGSLLRNHEYTHY
jgi:hypothetical protein